MTQRQEHQQTLAGALSQVALVCLAVLLLWGCRSARQEDVAAVPGDEKPSAATLPARAAPDAAAPTAAPTAPPAVKPDGPSPRRDLLDELLVETKADASVAAEGDDLGRALAEAKSAAAAPQSGAEPGGDDELRRAQELLAKLAVSETGGPAASRSPGAPVEPRSSPPATSLPPATRSGGAAAPAEAAAAAQPPAQEPKGGPEAPKASRPSGHVVLKTMYHKNASDLVKFLSEYWPDWVEKGHVAAVAEKPRSVIIFGEKPEPTDPLAVKIGQVVDEFDDLGLELEHAIVRPRYVDLDIVMDSLVMRGVAHIWQITEETDTLTWKQGDATRTASRKRTGYMETGLVQGATAPIQVAPKVPYVYEIPRQEPFTIPRSYSGANQQDQLLVSFDKMSSTEERGGMVAVGTTEDIERIRAFVESIDVPARRIMVEVQVVELEANKLSDLGFDSLQFGSGHHIGTLALPLPGEAVLQPGLGPDARRDPTNFVPPVVSEGFSFLFDDTSFDLQGRFLTRLHALVREGDAKLKARPKLLTLDDRTSVLHLGREVPTFKSTRVTRDSVEGNLISEVNEVTTQYVGLTLNMRPRVTGGAEDEVSLQIEILINELVGRARVFEEDLLGIPETIRRHYIGQTRVRNHRPVILGGLIQEQEVETVNKIPLLGEIPYLGLLFRRTQTSQVRREIILVVTPHILSDKGVDRAATPKESVQFDTFDSVLFNDRHIIKGSDVLGLDPVNNVPARDPQGNVFSEEDVVDLTLLNIVKKRQLVSKLDILDAYLGDEASSLNWIQRQWPESTVADWPDDRKELYFRAAAICIENIKELNPDVTFDELVLPRREIVLPSSPYQISLTFDRVKRIQKLGIGLVLRGERVELAEKHVELVRQSAGRSLRTFAEFLDKRERKSEDHGELPQELERLYKGLQPEGAKLELKTYPDLFRELEAAKLDFVSIATFLTTNLKERYEVSGRPDVGLFPTDLKDFLETSTSLLKRAKELKALEERWELVNSEEEDK